MEDKSGLIILLSVIGGIGSRGKDKKPVKINSKGV